MSGVSGLVSTAAITCTLAMAFTTSLVPLPAAQGCGLSDTRCGVGAAADWVVDEALDLYIDVADPLGGPIVWAYAKKSKGDDGCDSFTPRPPNCTSLGDRGGVLTLARKAANGDEKLARELARRAHLITGNSPLGAMESTCVQEDGTVWGKFGDGWEVIDYAW